MGAGAFHSLPDVLEHFVSNMMLGFDIDTVDPVLCEGNWFDVEVSVL